MKVRSKGHTCHALLQGLERGPNPHERLSLCPLCCARCVPPPNRAGLCRCIAATSAPHLPVPACAAPGAAGRAVRALLQTVAALPCWAGHACVNACAHDVHMPHMPCRAQQHSTAKGCSVGVRTPAARREWNPARRTTPGPTAESKRPRKALLHMSAILHVVLCAVSQTLGCQAGKTSLRAPALSRALDSEVSKARNSAQSAQGKSLRTASQNAHE